MAEQNNKGVDNQDDNFLVDPLSTRESIMNRCLSELSSPPDTRKSVSINQSEDLTVTKKSEQFRILSWNILAQTLAAEPGTFTSVPEGALDWETRRLRILYKILFYDPDVICLQEVDHFNFFNSNLTSVGYTGLFHAKLNSPCLKMIGNNGPDGCALFFRRRKFELVSTCHRILQGHEGAQSNQVCLVAKLKFLDSQKEMFVATTHLKARRGFEALRNLQGQYLATLLSSPEYNSKPLILCGDLNAVPTEPVLATIKEKLNMTSAYTKLYNGQEPPYTRWKIREHQVFKDTIDYILHNSHCDVKSILPVPEENQIGKNLPPNLEYPSDHIALVCDFQV